MDMADSMVSPQERSDYVTHQDTMLLNPATDHWNRKITALLLQHWRSHVSGKKEPQTLKAQNLNS